ncbi:MAG: iron ABC transporter permease [Erythrobacter sp.]
MSRFRPFALPRATANGPAGVPRDGLRGFDQWTLGALVIAGLAGLPLIAVLVSAPMGGMDAIGHLAASVLPRYLINTSALMAATGLIASFIGISAAWLVSTASFPGRKLFAWALVLPLAVPAYIAAYIYSDILAFSGPVQSALRAATGWQVGEYAFPQIRSLPGAALILSLVLYPYIYLLARAAFSSQSLNQFRAARSLGAAPSRAFFRIALPAARPAIAGGLALVLMEVLADFGVAEYFAIPTFSTGIFRSWLAMGDKQAALKLAAIMLVFVAVLVALEASSRKGSVESRDPNRDERILIDLTAWQKLGAVIVCGIPVLLGFVLPALHLVMLALETGDSQRAPALWSYAKDSLWLGLAVAAVCCGAALLLAFARRRSDGKFLRGAIRFATLGYALPGALLAVGLLAPLGAFDQVITRFSRETFGLSHGLLLAGTSIILVYALSVRFLTVAFNSISGGLEKVPPSLDAAARSLGATPGAVLRRIQLPLLTPSLAAAGALVFIDTLRELPATLILRPFNLETLATRVYRLASDEKLAEASTAALLILAAGLLPVLLLNRTKS